MRKQKKHLELVKERELKQVNQQFDALERKFTD